MEYLSIYLCCLWFLSFSSVQFSCSVVSDTLWPHESQYARPPCPSPTPEFTQTHVQWVSDAIESSHPLLFPSPLALNLFQHKGLSFPNELAISIKGSKYWSFSFSISPFNEYSGLISLQSKGLSRVFSSTIIQKNQFFGGQSSWSNSHIHTWLLEKP